MIQAKTIGRDKMHRELTTATVTMMHVVAAVFVVHVLEGFVLLTINHVILEVRLIHNTVVVPTIIPFKMCCI